MTRIVLQLRAIEAAALVLMGAGLWAAAAAPVNLARVPEGGLQPQAAMDAQGALHLVYLKGDPQACDVFYARRDAGRSRFSPPVRVNSQPGSAVAVGTVRGAQIALGRGGRVHVVWNGSGRAETNLAGGMPMLYARLDAAKAAFEPQRNLMTSTLDLDGGGSVAADAAGSVYVVWHGHRKGSPQGEQARAVWVASSRDDGRTFTTERQANPDATGACGCCGLKAFADARGRLGILYRSATADGTRDVRLLASKDQGKTFQSTLLGPWRIAICPMSTMALGPGPGDTWLAAWETASQIYRVSLDPARPGLAPVALPLAGHQASRKHPVIALSQGPEPRLLLAWTEGTAWAQGGSLAWELSDLDGSRAAFGHADGVPVWGSVAAVAERDGTFTVIY